MLSFLAIAQSVGGTQKQEKMLARVVFKNLQLYEKLFIGSWITFLTLFFLVGMKGGIVKH